MNFGCMEYGLDEKLPIYSGGLGVLAGDYLKAARDCNLPVVGIGILWRQDYTEQYIDENGNPYDVFVEHDFNDLKDTGITVTVNIRGETVPCRVWIAGLLYFSDYEPEPFAPTPLFQRNRLQVGRPFPPCPLDSTCTM